MKIKTSELIGAKLDWAVAESIGAYQGDYNLCEGGESWPAWIFPDWFSVRASTGEFMPSTDWSRAGPLIERFKVAVLPINVGLQNDQPELWFSTAFYDGSSADACYKAYADTALKSACRAIVGLKLGEEIEVPEEFV